jgi:type II secretory pathway pseudopilin PulG
MKSVRNKKRAGFTLTELALAALLVGVGLVSLVSLGRLAMRTALEVEDERRAAALADDVFATLRSASSQVYQEQGYAACIEFWQAVTNSDRRAVIDLLPADDWDPWTGENVARLLHPATASDRHITNAVRSANVTDDFSFPFYQTDEEDDYEFRPASEGFGTFWDARYRLSIDLSGGSPPSLVFVTLNVFPRTSHLLRADNEKIVESMTFFTCIPLEPLRQTLRGRDE